MTTDEGYCPTTSEPGELVVDTTQLAMVEQGLAELNIAITATDPVPAFDLALLTLEHKGLMEFGSPVTDVGPVLGELRARFAGRCGGWTPFLGKNRKMTSQFGAYPQTQSMSFWDPDHVEQTESIFKGGAGAGVRIGLLDTKIFDHPDLAGLDLRTPDHERFSTPANHLQFNFEEGHGVFAAGLILRQAPKATLVARHALNADGKASAWDFVKKLAEFLDDPERVSLIVLASGCRTYDGQPPLVLRRAIERLSPHIMIVAAAGNHGAVPGMAAESQITRNSATWPAALPGAVAVSVDQAEYSPDLPWVTTTIAESDPEAFVSTYLKAKNVAMKMPSRTIDFPTGYARWRGTSCAAAFLGGKIAARMSVGRTAEQALWDLQQAGTASVFSWQLEKS